MIKVRERRAHPRQRAEGRSGLRGPDALRVARDHGPCAASSPVTGTGVSASSPSPSSSPSAADHRGRLRLSLSRSARRSLPASRDHRRCVRQSRRHRAARRTRGREAAIHVVAHAPPCGSDQALRRILHATRTVDQADAAGTVAGSAHLPRAVLGHRTSGSGRRGAHRVRTRMAVAGTGELATGNGDFEHWLVVEDVAFVAQGHVAGIGGALVDQPAGDGPAVR